MRWVLAPGRWWRRRRSARRLSTEPLGNSEKVSLADEVELPEDGLAAIVGDSDDLILALARRIVAGDEDAGPGEYGLEQARQASAGVEIEALLVDDVWRAPAPVIVAAEV